MQVFSPISIPEIKVKYKERESWASYSAPWKKWQLFRNLWKICSPFNGEQISFTSFASENEHLCFNRIRAKWKKQRCMILAKSRWKRRETKRRTIILYKTYGRMQDTVSAEIWTKSLLLNPQYKDKRKS